MSFGDIRAALALADPAYALAELRASLEAAERGGRDVLAEWLALLARAGSALSGPRFAEAVRGAIADPDDPAALAVLAARLHHERLPRMAVTLLLRAHRFAPTDEAILAQLAAALAADGQHAQASAMLRDAPSPRGPSLGRRAAQACHALLAGNLDEPRTCLPELVRSSEPAHRELAAVIGGMLARADAIAHVTPLGGGDLRGWHFVITGGFLLHLAAHGRSAGMNGRYAFIHDAYKDCLDGVRRAARVMTALGQPIERILVVDERSSAILGHAAAQVLGCPVDPWSPARTGLVAVYDLTDLAPAALDELRRHRPEQVVLSHAASWTEEPPFAADLVTRLHQYGRAPWASHMGLDPTTGAPCEVAADNADVATLAARIAAAPTTDNAGAAADLAALLAIAEASSGLEASRAAGAMRRDGLRRRAWCGSPVQSLRFG